MGEGLDIEVNSQTPLLYNWDAVYQLRREQEILANGMDEADLMKLPFSSQYPARILPKKIDRVEEIATLLLEQFDLDQVQVFPVVNTGQRFPLDLFVRFIGKGHMLISIRSRGTTRALYHERFKDLRVKRLDKPGNSISRWLPCPLTELNEFAQWVSKNRALFGMSSKEIRKSRIKILVVWHPTFVGIHQPCHYRAIGEHAVLQVESATGGFVFVVGNSMFGSVAQSWEDYIGSPSESKSS